MSDPQHIVAVAGAFCDEMGQILLVRTERLRLGISMQKLGGGYIKDMHERFMREALKMARIGLENGELPIGAVVLNYSDPICQDIFLPCLRWMPCRFEPAFQPACIVT